MVWYLMSGSKQSSPNWNGTPTKTRERIVDEGQTYLDNQIRLATASDQRSASLAGVFTAAGGALVAGLATISGVETIHNPVPLYLGGGVAALMFFAAAGLCVWSASPVGMWLPGGEPGGWYGDVNTKKAYDDSLAEEAENIQDKIVENRTTIESITRFYKWGSRIGVLAPVVGTIVWALAAFISSPCPLVRV
jgi:hypothetical protein